MSDERDKIEALARLAMHFPVKAKSEQERALLWRDYLADLASYPAEAVDGACGEWRRSADSKRFPTSGELLALCRRMDAAKRTGATDDGGGAWRKLSDAEYDALPLSGKIRHHVILGNEAEIAAGPQWRGGPQGGPVAAADMPDSWRMWRERAANHHAEASRLRALMLGAVERRAA